MRRRLVRVKSHRVELPSHAGNPQRNRLVDTTRVGPTPRLLAVGEGGTWTLNRGDGSATRLDPLVARWPRQSPRKWSAKVAAPRGRLRDPGTADKAHVRQTMRGMRSVVLAERAEDVHDGNRVVSLPGTPRSSKAVEASINVPVVASLRTTQPAAADDVDRHPADGRNRCGLALRPAWFVRDARTGATRCDQRRQEKPKHGY